MEVKSNWLNNSDSLNMELFCEMTLTSYGKEMNYWQKENELTFTIIRSTWWLIENLHAGTLLIFHLITQIFHLFLLKAPQLILLTLYNP